MSDVRCIVRHGQRALSTRASGPRLSAPDALVVRKLSPVDLPAPAPFAPWSGAAAPVEAYTVDPLEPGGLLALSGCLSAPSVALGVQGEALGLVHTLRENLELRVFLQVLEHHGLAGLARRVQTCGTRFRMARLNHREGCSEDLGELVSVTNHCEVPGCPHCAAAVAKVRGSELAARVALRLSEMPDRLQRVHLLTLTLRSGLNAGDELSASYFRRAARAARGHWRTLWTDSLLPMLDYPGQVLTDEQLGLRGAVCKVEFGGEGHVHIHALVVGFKFISNKRSKDGEPGWLSREWAKLTGSHHVHVAEVREWVRKHRKHASGRPVSYASGLRGAVNEVCKYIAKPGHDGLKTVLGALVTAGMHGERRWDSFGSLRLSKQERAERLERFRWDPCPCCSSRFYVKGPWASTPEAAVVAFDNMERGLQERPRGPPPGRARTIARLKRELRTVGRPLTTNEQRRNARARARQLDIAIREHGMSPALALVELNRARAAVGLTAVKTFTTE